MTIQENDLSKETVKAAKMCNFFYFFFCACLVQKFLIKLNQIQPAKTNLLIRKDRSVLWQHEHLELSHRRQDQYLTHIASFSTQGDSQPKKLNWNTWKSGVSPSIFLPQPLLQKMHGILHKLKFYPSVILLMIRISQSVGENLDSYCKISFFFPFFPGRFTDLQRANIEAIRNRIFLYILVFLFCWSPGNFHWWNFQQQKKCG